MQKGNKDLGVVLGGALVAFLLASVFHFSYVSLGEPPLLAGLFPINESIWEHLKLPFYSLLLLIMIPQKYNGKKLDVCNKIVMIMISTFISIIVIMFGYYGLKCGLGVESLIIDLLLLGVGLILGLSHSVVYKNRKVSNVACVLGIVYIFGMIALFYYCSYNPPNLPLFIE